MDPAAVPVVENFDGDLEGIDDVLWRRAGAGANTVWYLKDPVTVSGNPVLATVGLTARDAGWFPTAGDADGDGTTDLVWHSPSARATET